MISFTKKLATFLLFVVGLNTIIAPSTLAQIADVSHELSRISLKYTENEVQKVGLIDKFQIDWLENSIGDIEQPFKITLRSDTLRLENPIYTNVILSSSWLSSKLHPEIVFEIIDVMHVENSTYRIDAVLDIKGIKEPITSEFRIQYSGSCKFLYGEFAISREEFDIGDDFIENLLSISDGITIDYRICLAL